MSVMNNALTSLVNKDKSENSPLQKAEVPKLKSSGKIAWLAGGFTLSLAIGGWAVSVNNPVTESSELLVLQQPSEDKEEIITTASVQEAEENNTDSSVILSKKESTSPTAKLTQSDDIIIYDVEKPAVKASSSPVAEKKAVKQKAVVKTKTVTEKAHPQPEKTQTAQVTVPRTETQSSKSVVTTKTKAKTKTAETDKPVLIAQTAAKKPDEQVEQDKQVIQSGSLNVEHVELTPEELAARAVSRAKRALDSNDLATAIKEYENALKYQPRDTTSRKKLAALYYSKQNLRKSVDVLRQGIRLEEDNQTLRIALSKLMIKEGQDEVALSPLLYMPEKPELRYLSLRAGLAQKAKNNEVALETYQMLTEKESDNARWWLGLGIQQERVLMYKEAKHSYTQALGRVGLSKKTQSFIRDRLSLLNSLEDTSSAD